MWACGWIRGKKSGRDSTVWSDRKDKLERCIEKKYSDEWEQKYAELEDHAGMPATGTKLYNWHFHQLSSSLDKIRSRKRLQRMTGGGTVWSNRKDKLERCIAQKKAEAKKVKKLK